MFSITALHGFLGQAKDFDVLNLNIKALDIFRTQPDSLTNWSRRLNSNLAPNNILMGYSMGGRLALHCLLNDNHKKIKAAIILAAHPGLEFMHQRIKRYEADRRWARRFIHEPWDKLIRDWETQEILQNSPQIIRDEKNFERHNLACALSYFSLSAQDYLVPKINQLDLPILWLEAQEESAKIRKLRLKNKSSRIYYMPHGGHRFMMAEPKATSKLIRKFLASLE